MGEGGGSKIFLGSGDFKINRNMKNIDIFKIAILSTRKRVKLLNDKTVLFKLLV